MGIVDEIESSERRRSLKLALAVAVLLIAAGGGYFLMHGWDAEEGHVHNATCGHLHDPGMPPEAVELGGGRGGMRPRALEFFDRSRAVSADGAEIGREIDAAYSYPQRLGVRGVRITFDSPFIDQQLRTWVKNYGGSEDQIAEANTDILYSWSAEEGAKIDITGWPADLQPLELDRHRMTLLKLAEVIVPRTQEEFLRGYGVRIERGTKGTVIWAKRADPDAALNEFVKYLSPNKMRSYIEGAGAHASFETITDYKSLGGQVVIEHMSTWVDTPNKVLRYEIEPVYGQFEDIWIAAQVTQTYYDESGKPEGMPLALLMKEFEFDRLQNTDGTPR